MSNTESILAVRRDILLEGYQNVDSSGHYASAWFDSSGLTHVRLAANYSSLNSSMDSFILEEASFNGVDDDSSRIAVRTQTVPVSGSYAYADLDLTARFFRLVASGTGAANSAFYLVARGL